MPTIKDIAPESVFTIELNAGTPGIQGPQGPQGVQGPVGPRGETGPKPIRGIDYFTQQDINNMVSTVTSSSNSAFNENVANRTTEFNSNVSIKTTAFDNNALLKTEDFNTNAKTKETDFNLNANNRTTEFNTNASNKKNEIDTHVTNKTTEFDNHVVEKIKEFKEETSEYVTETELESKGYLVESDLNGYAKEKDLFSGSYNDLKDKPKIPSKTSELTNDKGFINEIPSEYVTEEEQNEFIKPYNERITENEKYILDLEATIDILTNTNKAKGELVHITDALPLPTFETTTDGNVKQETTKGQQLFDYKDTITVSDEVTTDEDGWITMTYDNTNGTAIKYLNYWTRPLKLKENTKYNILCEIKNVSGTGSVFVVSISDDTPIQFTESQRIYLNNLTNNSIVKLIGTTKENLENIVSALRTYGQFNAGQSGSITFRLSVIEDTTVTPETFVYEKFTGGQASPNSSYEQPIEVLGAYNLLKITTFTDGSKKQTKNGVTATINDNGTITCKGTATDVITFYLTKNDLDFTLGDGYFLCNSPSANQRLEFMCSTDGADRYLNSYGSGNFINAKTSFVFKMAYISIAKGEEIDVTFKPMFAKGTIQKPYLPYGCVGIKNVGKNLFDKDDCLIGYTINATTGLEQTSSNNGASKGFIKVKPNTIYTFSANNTMSDLRVSEYSTKQEHIKRTVKSSSNSYTFTTTADTHYVKLSWNYNNITMTQDLIDSLELMLEPSLSRTNYEPYKEQIVYLDLKGNWVGAINDNIKDYLVNDKKKYWLVKNVRKRIFTGEEDWVENTSVGTIELLINDKYARYGFDGLMCSHFHIRTGTDTSNYVGIDNNHTNIRIWGTNMTLDEFKAFAKEEYDKGTPITLVYQTKETETKHLGELPEPIKTFEGTNNIQLLANLDTEIEVKYGLDLKKYYDNKLAEISAQII